MRLIKAFAALWGIAVIGYLGYVVYGFIMAALREIERYGI